MTRTYLSAASKYSTSATGTITSALPWAPVWLAWMSVSLGGAGLWNAWGARSAPAWASRAESWASSAGVGAVLAVLAGVKAADAGAESWCLSEGMAGCV